MDNLHPFFEGIFRACAPNLFPDRRCFYCGGKIEECHHGQGPEERDDTNARTSAQIDQDNARAINAQVHR